MISSRIFHKQLDDTPVYLRTGKTPVVLNQPLQTPVSPQQQKSQDEELQSRIEQEVATLQIVEREDTGQVAVAEPTEDSPAETITMEEASEEDDWTGLFVPKPVELPSLSPFGLIFSTLDSWITKQTHQFTQNQEVVPEDEVTSIEDPSTVAQRQQAVLTSIKL